MLIFTYINATQLACWQERKCNCREELPS